MIRQTSKWALALPVPGMPGVKFLGDTLYKEGKSLTTQQDGCVRLRIPGRRNTACVHLDTVRYAVATGRDVFFATTRQLARAAKKDTYKTTVRDHILWMQTVLLAVEQNEPDIVTEYLYCQYFDDLSRVLGYGHEAKSAKKAEAALWDAIKTVAKATVEEHKFIYAPAPYIIQCTKASLADKRQ